MALVTVPRMRAAYAFLVAMPPFSRWKMPPPDAVRFYPIRDLKDWGAYNNEYGEHRIGVNVHLVTTMPLLLRVVAHEAVHLRQEMLGRRPATLDEQHNKTYYRLAGSVCQALGFDPETF